MACLKFLSATSFFSALWLRNIRATKVVVITVFWVSVCGASEAELRKDVEVILFEENLTGIAWSLIEENSEVSLDVVGVRDNLSKASFTVDTRFHVGSLTKIVLATGILRLVTEGRIDLDKPVSHYLPDLTFDNPWAGISDVTVRHLLDHTSGLNDAHMWQMFSERAKPDMPLIAAFPEPETHLRVRAQPGSRFSYSNMGYTLLGMIVESVVDGPYEAYLDEHVLVPLGMQNSTFAFTTQQGKNADPMLAWGHVDDGSRYAASPMFLRPAGQFTSSAADLAAFARFLLSDGVIDGQPFIDETLMRSRGRASGTGASKAGLVAGYALGLGRRDRHGVVGYCHGGNIVGFVAMLCVFPDENKAFAYSVNTDSETADYGRFNRLFIDALKIAGASPPQTIDVSPDNSAWYGRYILSPNRFQAFEYLDTVFGAIKISPVGDSLGLTSLQLAPRELRQVSDRIFSANDRSTASHVFLRGEEGEYLLSDGFQTYEKVSPVYLIAHWVSVILGLGGLTWAFLAGLIGLLRYRSHMLRRPEFPAFLAVTLLFAPAPFFMSQSFMALGDFTVASVLLAVATLLLPFGMVWTVILAVKSGIKSRINRLHTWAALFVLQWCFVLVTAGMLPFRLWV